MPRIRLLGAALLVAAVTATLATGCSKDDEQVAENDRGTITFADAPEGSTSLGLCYPYDIAQMKELIGGGNTFKRLAPSAIGSEGDPVTGEVCAWERNAENGDVLSLRIEARTFADQATLESQFASLQDGTLEAQPVEGFGDAAFSSVSDETSLLQIRSGPYLLTLASRGTGELAPLDLDTLKLLSAAGMEQLP